MRLTLRTLLAYMDDILEPEDREDLRAKIENSEFAGDLLNRAGDVMRRLRLGAPAVTDPRKGTDANFVAEYLDNTLPPEQVADFERLCLESDEQLAEVASCHQILTMVLGEPADVRPESRKRMYDIPAQADLHGAEAGEDGERLAESPPVEMPQIDVRKRPVSHVPDYLRESFFERHGGKLVIAALLLIAGLLFLFWPSGEIREPEEYAQRADQELELPPVDEGDGVDEDAAAPTEAAEDAAELPEAPPFQPPAPDEEGTAGDEAATADDGADPPLESSDLPEVPPLPPILADQADRRAGEEGEAASALPGGDQMRLPSGGEDSAGEPDLPAAPVPTIELGGSAPEGGVASGVTAADTSPPSPPADEQPAAGEVAFGEGAEDAERVEEATTPTTAVAEPPPPGEPEHVATYVSRGEMLMRYDERADAWIRLAPLAQLREGDQLLAPPASRPIITLPTTNLSVQLQPATRLILAADTLPNLGGADQGDMAPAGLTVQYGRVVMFNPAQSSNWVAVRVRLGESVYVVELDGGSTVALDVRREMPPGVDPLENEGDLVADVFATTGQVRWQNGDSVQMVDPPAHWQVVGSDVGPVEPLAREPRWISEDTASDSDRLAVGVVEPAVAVGESARVSLAELAQRRILQRRREVKSLVTRASVHVGDFEPFVKALNDTSQNQVWDEHIATLRRALALGPQVAEKIRDAFRNYKGQEAGDELFRMLWGYSKSQLENGALEKLIDDLDHESLDVRVLAFNNLYRATGKRLYYSPQDTPQKREGPVREWRMRLMEGDLEVRPQGTGA